MSTLLTKLEQINWDFSDYNSLKYPLDINSIPWYPATFPPPIPRFLVALLSDEGDTVLDPFGGKGTTAVESIKLNRKAIYNDLNPFAVDITESTIQTILQYSQNADFINDITNEEKISCGEQSRLCPDESYAQEEDLLVTYKSSVKELEKASIATEALHWYHVDTLNELTSIKNSILDSEANSTFARRLAFVSILKETCSQRDHFTYVTDNCKPKELKYHSAIDSYISMLKRIDLSTKDFIRQFTTTVPDGSLPSLIEASQLNSGDARNMPWLKSESVDLVVTSPPYLCAQDYIKTMRLTNMFFPNEGFKELPSTEIGPRRSRYGKTERVVGDFYSDMKMVFAEINRVLKNEKYFCLIIGQGKGKVTKSFDTINDLASILTTDFSFVEVFRTDRRIGHRMVRIGGVDAETILIFRKSEKR